MKLSNYLSCNRKLLSILSSRQIFKSDNFLTRNYCIEDQRTTVDILNRPGHGPLMINSYSPTGFRLSNGLFVVGPIIIFPSTVLSWNVANDEDIGEDSLIIFSKIEPKLDIVLIGLSDKSNKSRENVNRIFKIFRSFKINCEVLQSDRACPTFNFLNNEGRYVAAALVPPLKVHLTGTDFSEEFKRMKREMKDDFLLGTDTIDEMAREISSPRKPGPRESMLGQSSEQSKPDKKVGGK